MGTKILVENDTDTINVVKFQDMKYEFIHSVISCTDLLFVWISIHAWPFKACVVYSFESITVINSAVLLTI